MNNLLFGVLITAVSQVVEVVDKSSAIAFIPESTIQVTEYLNEIDNRAVPIIVVNDYYRDESGRFIYYPPDDLKEALAVSNHFGRIAFMFDEWLHHGTQAGQTRAEVIQVMRQIKADFPGVEMIHIEAFTDLYAQYMENYGRLELFYEADHIGFDCYGQFESCGGFGVPELPQMVYLITIFNQIAENQSNAKIFLVPGAFMGAGIGASESTMIDQLNDYALTYERNRQYISGFGVFIWGDMEGLTGARNVPAIKSTVENILNWFSNPLKDLKNE